MVFLGFGRKYGLSEIEAIAKQRNANFGIMEKRSKVDIAVVDDKQFQPLDNLRDSGFEVAFIGNLADVRAVEKYPIVLCDIGGVANKMSEEFEGAALIGEIKRIYPEKSVIVYTAFTNRNPKVKYALRFADASIAKSADLNRWVIMLDKQIDIVLNPTEIWKRTRQHMLDINTPAKIIALTEHNFAKSLVKGDVFFLKKMLKKADVTDDVRIVIRSLVTSALWAMIVV